MANRQFTSRAQFEAHVKRHQAIAQAVQRGSRSKSLEVLLKVHPNGHVDIFQGSRFHGWMTSLEEFYQQIAEIVAADPTAKSEWETAVVTTTHIEPTEVKSPL